MASEIIQKTDEQFYSDAINYWSEIPATIDGMLGGFGFISLTDIKGSKLLLKQLFNSKCPPGREYALDCGAGIGRITKFLLTDLFDKVDMVEQNRTFLEQAEQYLGPKKDKVGNYYALGLQDFQPEARKYDVIWIQWVLGHLTNKDLLQFLENCKTGLKENGVIIVKENVTASDDLELDRNDSSVTRSMKLLRGLFSKANLDCYRLVKQHNFPKGLYSVYMFVLRPKARNDHEEVLDNVTSVQINEIDVNNRGAYINGQIESTGEHDIKKEENDSLGQIKNIANVIENANGYDEDKHMKVDFVKIEVCKGDSDVLQIEKTNECCPEITKECRNMDDVILPDENINCDTFSQNVG